MDRKEKVINDLKSIAIEEFKYYSSRCIMGLIILLLMP